MGSAFGFYLAPKILNHSILENCEAIYGQDRAKYSFPGAVVATWLQVDGPNYLYGMGRLRGLNVKPDADCMVAQQFQSFLAAKPVVKSCAFSFGNCSPNVFLSTVKAKVVEISVCLEICC